MRGKFELHSQQDNSRQLRSKASLVFENGVDDVAGFFADALASDEWRGRFEAIVFAVPGQGRGAQMRDVFSRRIAALL